jgi:hypothetical protein
LYKSIPDIESVMKMTRHESRPAVLAFINRTMISHIANAPRGLFGCCLNYDSIILLVETVTVVTMLYIGES